MRLESCTCTWQPWWVQTVLNALYSPADGWETITVVEPWVSRAALPTPTAEAEPTSTVPSGAVTLESPSAQEASNAPDATAPVMRVARREKTRAEESVSAVAATASTALDSTAADAVAPDAAGEAHAF